MQNVLATIPSLLIPIQEHTLLLPNAAVAEIVPYAAPRRVPDAPEWLLGLFAWRGIRIPLMSYEAVIGRGVCGTKGRIRVVVFNALGGRRELPFFGIVAQGIPHLTHAHQSVVSVAVGEQDDHQGVLGHALMHGEPVLIPDLEALEALLLATPGADRIFADQARSA